MVHARHYALIIPPKKIFQKDRAFPPRKVKRDKKTRRKKTWLMSSTFNKERRVFPAHYVCKGGTVVDKCGHVTRPMLLWATGQRWPIKRPRTSRADEPHERSHYNIMLCEATDNKVEATKCARRSVHSKHSAATPVLHPICLRITLASIELIVSMGKLSNVLLDRTAKYVPPVVASDGISLPLGIQRSSKNNGTKHAQTGNMSSPDCANTWTVRKDVKTSHYPTAVLPHLRSTVRPRGTQHSDYHEGHSLKGCKDSNTLKATTSKHLQKAADHWRATTLPRPTGSDTPKLLRP